MKEIGRGVLYMCWHNCKNLNFKIFFVGNDSLMPKILDFRKLQKIQKFTFLMAILLRIIC